MYSSDKMTCFLIFFTLLSLSSNAPLVTARLRASEDPQKTEETDGSATEESKASEAELVAGREGAAEAPAKPAPAPTGACATSTTSTEEDHLSFLENFCTDDSNNPSLITLHAIKKFEFYVEDKQDSSKSGWKSVSGNSLNGMITLDSGAKTIEIPRWRSFNIPIWSDFGEEGLVLGKVSDAKKPEFKPVLKDEKFKFYEATIFVHSEFNQKEFAEKGFISKFKFQFSLDPTATAGHPSEHSAAVATAPPPPLPPAPVPEPETEAASAAAAAESVDGGESASAGGTMTHEEKVSALLDQMRKVYTEMKGMGKGEAAVTFYNCSARMAMIKHKDGWCPQKSGQWGEWTMTNVDVKFIPVFRNSEGNPCDPLSDENCFNVDLEVELLQFNPDEERPDAFGVKPERTYKELNDTEKMFMHLPRYRVDRLDELEASQKDASNFMGLKLGLRTLRRSILTNATIEIPFEQNGGRKLEYLGCVQGILRQVQAEARLFDAPRDSAASWNYALVREFQDKVKELKQELREARVEEAKRKGAEARKKVAEAGLAAAAAAAGEDAEEEKM